MDRNTELLIRRAIPLVFGIFGQIPGTSGERIVRVGGSGIFIAPFLGLTARHIDRDLLRMEWQANRTHPGYSVTQHSEALFQVYEPFGGRPRWATWNVNRT